MASDLDDEIDDLQAKIASLKKQLRIQTSTLITAPSTRQLFTEAADQPTTTLTLPRKDNTTTTTTTTDAATLNPKLRAQSALQQAHNQQSLYRACATLTTFRARDPDPHAVDGGAILGLRVEVISRARFLRPYYVLLNRPYPGGGGGGGGGGGSRLLRVHRHTLPPCIPLAGLAGRYLPAPPAKKPAGRGGDGDGGVGRQDLARFARALRREVVRYHHRLGVVADLRKAAGMGRERDEEGEEEQLNRLVDIAPADAEAKHLSIEWADGRTGRLVMGDDGEIVKLVVLGENGRDREAGRDLLGGAVRVEEVVKRMAALT
ncbi:Cenp-O kinetochore centromere component-domain-containing protein [Chaetomidium leptoderma]|uniref:Cenp-O kinetochore centromere component-domain-containing protein n=1 Tax=Chaetomidium leptoderma TaxID=669021 RepID=A0AAN6VQ67_9PEZI|nr:Cenp-O kinetochore centromere component-domain-containing protein [Chaetomidium leptoderma]